MKLVDANIRWNDDWAKSPDLILVFDEIDYSDLVYRKEGNWYIGIHQTFPWLNKIVYEDPKPSKWPGAFNPLCTMEDGSQHQVSNGWMSNRGQFKKELGLEVFEVVIKEEGKEKSGGMAGFNIDLEFMKTLPEKFEFDRPFELAFDEGMEWIKIVKQPAWSPHG